MPTVVGSNPGWGNVYLKIFAARVLMYVPFFKENYDDVLSQHIKKIKKIKITMIFVDKKIQTKNFAKSTGAAIYDC